MAPYNKSSGHVDLVAKVKTLDAKFRRACHLVVIMNNQIKQLKTRYDRAAARNQRRFRCALRLRLATIEGVRNMFYEYASEKCGEIEDIQDQLLESESSGLESEEIQSASEDEIETESWSDSDM